MSERVRAALARQFGLNGNWLDNYAEKLSDLDNEKVLIDVIELLAKENKGKKTPKWSDIRDRFFEVFTGTKKIETHTSNCGVYCYQTKKLVPNGAKIVPCGDMVKVSIENPQDNKNHVWEEAVAWKYIWDCVDAWREEEGIKLNPNKKQDDAIKAALRSFKESHKRISIAANRPPIQYPKAQDIYEEALPF